jgi:hypothetical protein
MHELYVCLAFIELDVCYYMQIVFSFRNCMQIVFSFTN